MNRHPLNPITDEHRADYARDGVVCLRGMFDQEWIARLRRVADRVIADPEKFGVIGPSQGDTMTSVCFVNRTDADVRDFVLNSPAAEITGRVIGAREIRLYHDHLFHKPPHSPKIMQWHVDATAWPVTGEMAPNIWLALTPTNAENGRVEFVAGHHRYCVDNGISYGFRADQAGGLCPNFESRRDDPNTRFVTWDLEPGDALLFHPSTPHFSKGNDSASQHRTGIALRLFGDDVRWNPLDYKARIPGVDRLTPGERPSGEFFPVLWTDPERAA